jgi:hypothetical protein
MAIGARLPAKERVETVLPFYVDEVRREAEQI